MTTTSTAASSVSATLRRAGFNPLGSGTPRSREGVRVTQGYSKATVTVSVDIDAPSAARSLTESVTEALVAAGYSVKVNPLAEAILTVTKA